MLKRLVPAIVSLTLVVLAPAPKAQITGFQNFTTNTNGTGGPTISAGTLTLTDGGFFEARSAFDKTPQPIGHFTATFTYQATSPGGIGLADGATFMLQNLGPTALGGSGGALGITGISPSAEIELNVYAGHVVGTNFETNGANSMNYLSTAPVDWAAPRFLVHLK
jgi:hypothetical protein